MNYFDRLKSYILPSGNNEAVDSANDIPMEKSTDVLSNDAINLFNEVNSSELFNDVSIDNKKREKEDKWLNDIGFSGISFDDKGNEKEITLYNPYGHNINYLIDLDVDDDDNEELKKLSKKHNIDYHLIKALSQDNEFMDEDPEQEIKIIKRLHNRANNDKDIDNVRDTIISYKTSPVYVYGNDIMSSDSKIKNKKELDNILTSYLKFKDA